MSKGENRIARKVSALTIVACFVLIMAFSAYISGYEHFHECTGDDCPICDLVSICENTVRAIGTAVVMIAVFSFIAKTTNIIQSDEPVFTVKSLISDKVRLND